VNVTADVVTPVVAWSTWTVSVAVASPHLPERWFTRGARGRAARTVGRRAARRHRRWTRLLPDAGAVIPGASSKRRLPGLDRSSLERHAVEAFRGEVVHWSSVAFATAGLAWWPAVVAGPLLAVAVLVNVPCAVSLRQTRHRIHRVLDQHPRPPLPPA
jgi:hypothetical protein